MKEKEENEETGRKGNKLQWGNQQSWRQEVAKFDDTWSVKIRQLMVQIYVQQSLKSPLLWGLKRQGLVKQINNKTGTIL